MELIYRTKEQKGYGKQNYYWNEYRREGNTIYKFRCNRSRSFDGKENTWSHSEHEEDHWSIDDPKMPEWLHNYL